MKDNLNEEILRQLSLIKFDRSKTLLEQNEIENNIIFRNDSVTINEEVEKIDWCSTAEANKIKGELKDRGFFTIPIGYWEWKCQGLVYDETSGKYVHSGYNSLVEAKNDAAFGAMRYFTKLVTDQNYFDADLGVSVLSGGGTRFKFDKYGAYMINTLRNTLNSYNITNATKDIKYKLPATDKTTAFNPYDYDPESFNPFSKGLVFRPEEDKNLEVFPRSFFIDPNRTIYNTYYLRDFYFDYWNIYKRPDLFANGPWDFMMKFFEDPDVQGVVGTIKAGNAGVKPSYNYKTGKVTDIDEYGRFRGDLLMATHILLATGSLILSFVPLPQAQAISMGLDFVDGLLYATVDKDPYMAGFTWAMMAIPFSEMNRLSKVLKNSEKGAEVALLGFTKRLANGSEFLLETDIKFLNIAIKTAWTTEKFVNTIKKIVSVVIKTLKSERVVAFVFHLAKTFGWNYSLLRIIYKIWGVSFAYDYIAYKTIGRCSQTFSWTDMTGHFLNFKVLKKPKKFTGPTPDLAILKGKIFDLRNEVLVLFDPQKFTQNKQLCEALSELEYYKNLEKSMQNQLKEQNDPDFLFSTQCVNSLTGLIEQNAVLTKEKYGTRFETDVEIIQNILLLCVGTVKIGVDYEVNHYFNLSGDKPTKLKGFFADIQKYDSEGNPKGNTVFGVAKNYNYSTIEFSNVSGVKKIELLSNIGVQSKPTKVVETIYPKGKNKVETKKLSLGSLFSFKIEFLDGTIKTSDDITITPAGTTMLGAVEKGELTIKRLNYGFFDDTTKLYVETFQSQNGLKPNGVIDKSTLTKLLDVVEEKKCGKIKNISGFEVTKEDEWYAQQYAAAEETIKNGPDAIPYPSINLSEKQKQDTLNTIMDQYETIDTDENRQKLMNMLEQLKSTSSNYE